MVQRKRNRRLTRCCSVFAAVFVVLAPGVSWSVEPAAAKSLFDGVDSRFGADTPAAKDADGADYHAAAAAFDAVWTQMPLTVQHAMFVKQKATGYGVYDKRPSNEFAQGETLYFYAEPLGYSWKQGDDGYTFGVMADLSLKDEDGNSLYDKADFANLQLSSHEKNREFMINFDLALTGLKPGQYKVAVTLHDINSAKTTAFTLPFKIASGT